MPNSKVLDLKLITTLTIYDALHQLSNWSNYSEVSIMYALSQDVGNVFNHARYSKVR